MIEKKSRPSLLKRVGEVYKMLESAFPDYRSKQDVLAIPQLAKDLGYQNETLYRAVREDCIKLRVALRLLEHSHKNQPVSNRLYWQDLAPYVLPEYEKYSDPLAG